MIKTLLKHSIYEYAIDAFFSSIRGNFLRMNSEFLVGSKFKEITLEDIFSFSTIKISYVDCTVISMHDTNILITHSDMIIEIFVDSVLQSTTSKPQRMSTLIGINKITEIKR